MPMRILIATVVLLIAGPSRPIEAEEPLLPELDRLRHDVFRLASPDFEGRSGDGARAAGDLLIARLRGLGLEPGFDGRFDQEFTAGDLRGRNLAALLPGADPARSDVIILSAHYDHLGVRGGRLFPGADDNATAVAMVLEIARLLAERPEPPARGILFVFFDLEENGLLGSQHFVREPPVPLDRVGLFVTADMLGRSLAGVGGDSLFVMGTEHAPGLRPWIFEAADGLPLEVGVVGADLLVIDRSDYGPFRWRSVPFLFFSTGESPVYHTPQDVPETIDYAKLSASTTLIDRIIRRAASAEDLPVWTSDREPWIEEAEAIRGVLSLLLDHQDDLEIPAPQRAMMAGMVDRIDGWIEQGTISPQQRTTMLRVAQVVLFTVL